MSVILSAIVPAIQEAADALKSPKNPFWFGPSQDLQDESYFYDDIVIGRMNRGKARSISRPSPKLMSLQRSLLDYGIRDVPVHHSATAYRKGGSITLNARRHAGQAYLFKTDIVDFFPSISPDPVIDTVCQYIPGMPTELKSQLCTVLSRNGKLATGSPTSPQLSNLFMKDFDERLFSLAQSRGVNYTRYSDDLALSGFDRGSVVELSEVLKEALAGAGLAINHRKTRLLEQTDRKIVTGLDVTSRSIRPTRRFRRRTQALIRMFEKFQKHQLTMPISGRLSFWNSVSPLDPELAELRERFSAVCAERRRSIERDGEIQQRALEPELQKLLDEGWVL